MGPHSNGCPAGSRRAPAATPRAFLYMVLYSLVRWIVLLVWAMALAGCLGGRDDGVRGGTDPSQGQTTNQVEAAKMNLTSAAFKEGGMIPAKYTCDGDDVNPPLRLEGLPSGTASMALIVDDPDAPAGTWVHWVVWDIDPKAPEVAENSAWGTEGITSFRTAGYGGPCPPSGVHRYIFKAYALERRLGLPATAGTGELLKAMEGHILVQAQLMGKYGRTKH